jgi:hypothetical protein
MTVPPLFGWEGVLAVVALVVVIAVAFFVASAAGRGADSRSEWMAGLAARSSMPPDPPIDRDARSAELFPPDRTQPPEGRSPSGP